MSFVDGGAASQLKFLTLNLINSFDNTLQSFSASPVSFFLTSDAQQVSTYVTNLGNSSYNKVDQGFGVGWVTVTNDTNNVFFDVDLNDTEAFRNITIEITNQVTLQVIEITIAQKAPIILASSDVIKADSNAITADNG